MTDTTQTTSLESLSPADRAAYTRAIAKKNDPNAKPLTEKEHDVYDLVHGAGASIMPPDGMTDDERARIALEAQHQVPPEDPALFDAAAARRGSVGANIPTDSYELNEREGIDSVAAARRGLEASDQRVRTPADAMLGRPVWDNPPPFESQRPTAPLPGDADAPAGSLVDGNRRTSARPGVDSIELAQAYDELDHLLGSGRRRERMSFDWCREPLTGHRFVFSRHYYDRGVLVDRFSEASVRVAREVAGKSQQIEAYNARCSDPREQIGYLAYVAGVELSFDDVAPALERKISTKIIAAAQKGFGETLDPNVIHNLSSVQVMPPKAARIGERPLEMGDGRTPIAVYYHDAMKGIFTVHVDAVVGTGRSRDAAEADARRQSQTALAGTTLQGAAT